MKPVASSKLNIVLAYLSCGTTCGISKVYTLKAFATYLPRSDDLCVEDHTRPCIFEVL